MDAHIYRHALSVKMSIGVLLAVLIFAANFMLLETCSDRNTMHIHILGACGTFMGGVALLAKRAGHRVSGSDQHTYPPMSTQLEAEGIELFEGYSPEHLDPAPDLVIIGNALSRGNPAVEYVLNSGINTPPARAGWVKTTCAANQSSPLPALTAKPPPPAWWPGSLRPPAANPGF